VFFLLCSRNYNTRVIRKGIIRCIPEHNGYVNHVYITITYNLRIKLVVNTTGTHISNPV
jgi:hypothetical protein